MTDEESLQLKAKTVVELSDLRQERTNLRAKADVFLNEILRARAVLELLKSRDFKPDDKSAPTANNWPSADDILGLAKELAATEEQIEHLNLRPRQWGAID